MDFEETFCSAPPPPHTKRCLFDELPRPFLSYGAGGPLFILYYLKFPLAPMEVLAPRLHTFDGSARPPITQAEIFRRTCMQSHLESSPTTPQESYQKFWNPMTTFQNTPFPTKNCIVRGVRGVFNFFWLDSQYFCYLGAKIKK
jgi:hypothetical protein